MTRELTLWLSALTGPVVWFISLEANFVFAPGAHRSEIRLILYLVSLVALILTAIAGWISWIGWHRIGDREGPSTKALSISGFILSCMFFLVILAQAIPNLMMSGYE